MWCVQVTPVMRNNVWRHNNLIKHTFSVKKMYFIDRKTVKVIQLSAKRPTLSYLFKVQRRLVTRFFWNGWINANVFVAMLLNWSVGLLTLSRRSDPFHLRWQWINPNSSHQKWFFFCVCVHSTSHRCVCLLPCAELWCNQLLSSFTAVAMKCTGKDVCLCV